MYCGSCLRDNLLATELKALGHDVLLLPLYTPTRTDEPNVSDSHVFFGGVSVYLQQHVPLFRHTPRAVDRLLDSPALLRAVSKRAMSVDPAALGDLTISVLRGEHGHQRKELHKLVDRLRSGLTPDCVDMQSSLFIGLARPIREALGCPVCCTLQGEDLFLEGLPASHREEAVRLIRAAVPHVDVFIAVSSYYADFMSDYLGIPSAKMRVVPLGVHTDRFAGLPRRADPVATYTIGYFARIAPEKGLHVLCEAYHLLRERKGVPAARLEAAGYLGAEHSGYLESIRREMDAWGLGGEFRYHGALELEQKIAFLQSLDVLSVPCTYDEPKGLSLIEAMAAGVPVVQPPRGSFPELLERTGGGLIVNDLTPEALADGLYTLSQDRVRTAALGTAGQEGVRRHYSARAMAERAMTVYEELTETSSR